MRRYATKVWLRDPLANFPPVDDIKYLEVGEGDLSPDPETLYCLSIVVNEEGIVASSKEFEPITINNGNIAGMVVHKLPEGSSSGNEPGMPIPPDV